VRSIPRLLRTHNARLLLSGRWRLQRLHWLQCNITTLSTFSEEDNKEGKKLNEQTAESGLLAHAFGFNGGSLPLRHVHWDIGRTSLWSRSSLTPSLASLHVFRFDLHLTFLLDLLHLSELFAIHPLKAQVHHSFWTCSLAGLVLHPHLLFFNPYLSTSLISFLYTHEKRSALHPCLGLTILSLNLSLALAPHLHHT
jgi:hypothetical protein